MYTENLETSKVYFTWSSCYETTWCRPSREFVCGKIPLAFYFGLLQKGILISCPQWETLTRYKTNLRNNDILLKLSVMNQCHAKEDDTRMYKHPVNSLRVGSTVATIIFIIFWEFLMFYQIFLSPQLKQCTIVTYKHGI